jgi:hypothetical protein
LSPTAGNEIVHVSRRTYLKTAQELHETAKVGDPQINLANQLLDLRTLPQLWHFADLQHADPILFVICGFKTSPSPQKHAFSP